MQWHDLLTDWKLLLEHDDDGWPVKVAYELTVAYSGYDGDAKPDLRVYGSSPVEMTRISLTPDNFDPAPASIADAKAMIEPYFPRIRECVAVLDGDGEEFPRSGQILFRFPARRQGR